MELSKHIAKQLRAVYMGGSWSGPDLKGHLTGITWELATQQVYGLNTIATLIFHMNYYIAGVIQFLEGGTLEIRDKFSFDHPPIASENDWNAFIEKIFQDCERCASLIETVPLDKMWEVFHEEKYGDYYRNLTGLIEHFNYHLGQVVVLKKILQQKNAENG